MIRKHLEFWAANLRRCAKCHLLCLNTYVADGGNFCFLTQPQQTVPAKLFSDGHVSCLISLSDIEMSKLSLPSFYLVNGIVQESDQQRSAICKCRLGKDHSRGRCTTAIQAQPSKRQSLVHPNYIWHLADLKRLEMNRHRNRFGNLATRVANGDIMVGFGL